MATQRGLTTYRDMMWSTPTSRKAHDVCGQRSPSSITHRKVGVPGDVSMSQHTSTQAQHAWVVPIVSSHSLRLVCGQRAERRRQAAAAASTGSALRPPSLASSGIGIVHHDDARPGLQPLPFHRGPVRFNLAQRAASRRDPSVQATGRLTSRASASWSAHAKRRRRHQWRRPL